MHIIKQYKEQSLSRARFTHENKSTKRPEDNNLATLLVAYRKTKRNNTRTENLTRHNLLLPPPSHIYARLALQNIHDVSRSSADHIKAAL